MNLLLSALGDQNFSPFSLRGVDSNSSNRAANLAGKRSGCALRIEGGGEQARRVLGQDKNLFILKLKGSLQTQWSASYLGLGEGHECCGLKVEAPREVWG